MPSASPSAAQGRRGFWDAARETMDRGELAAMRDELVERQVRYVYANAPFFRKRMQDASLHPADIRSVADLPKLPAMTKDDLREWQERSGDPFGGTLCVPVSQLAFVTHSSGTSGRPNLYGLTHADWDRAADMFARSSYTAGMRAGDVIVLPGGLRWHGAMLCWDKSYDEMGIVKIYVGNSTMDVVSELFPLAEGLEELTIGMVYQPEIERRHMEANDLDPKPLFPNLRMVWAGVDASAARRKLIEETWGVPFRNQYCSGDQFWSCGECPDDWRYAHVAEDGFVAEVVDPSDGSPVGPGEKGMLVITNLWSESGPFLRYDIGDMVDYQEGPCSCGRTSMRLRVHGRLAWSVPVEGTRVFSQQVEEVLWRQPELLACNYQLLRTREGPEPELAVRIEAGGQVDDEVARNAERLLSEEFGVSASVAAVDAGSIGMKGIKMERVASVPGDGGKS